MVPRSSLTASRSGVGALSPNDNEVSEDFVGEGGLEGDFDWSIVVDIARLGLRGDGGREGRGVARVADMAGLVKQ
jgi:hypothetical protein